MFSRHTGPLEVLAFVGRVANDMLQFQNRIKI